MRIFLTALAVLCLKAGACEQDLISPRPQIQANAIHSFFYNGNQIRVVFAKSVSKELNSVKFEDEAFEQLLAVLNMCVNFDGGANYCKRLVSAPDILEIRMRGKRFGNYRFYARWQGGFLVVEEFIRAHNRPNDIARAVKRMR